MCFDEEERPARESSPKSKKPKEIVVTMLYDPAEVIPMGWTEERWRGVLSEDIHAACASAGSSNEGAIEETHDLTYT